MLRLGAELGFPGSNAQFTLHYAEADIGLDIPIEAWETGSGRESYSCHYWLQTAPAA